MFHIERVLVLLFALTAAWAIQDVALVRPFASEMEFAALKASFANWNSLLPCSGANESNTDLILVYSGALDGTLKDEVDAFVADFDAGNEAWHACFAECTAQENNIPTEKDIYNDERGAVGPNLQFARISQAFQVSAYVEAHSWFLMEADTTPRRSGWLDRMVELSIASRPFGVLGSHYTGDKWFPFYDDINAALRTHINGNAIYTSNEVLFNAIVKEIEARTESAFQASTKVESYDYMFRQIYNEATDPSCTGDLCAAFTASKDEGMSLFMNDLQDIVANYAKTNMLEQNYDDEYLEHGAHHVNHKTDLALVVSMFAGGEDGVQSIISTIEGGNTPFSEVVVVSPDGTQEFTSASLLVKNVHVDPAANRFDDLCFASSQISESHFVHTNSHFTIMPTSFVYESLDGQQVLQSGVDTEGDTEGEYCSSKTCMFLDERARTMLVDVGLQLQAGAKIYDTQDTVYHTATFAEFCPAFAGWFNDYRICDHCSPSTDQCVLGDNVFDLIEENCFDGENKVCTCNQLIWGENYTTDGFDPYPGPSPLDYNAFCATKAACWTSYSYQDRSVYGQRSVTLREAVPPYDKYSEWFFGSESAYLENTPVAGCEKNDEADCGTGCEYQQKFSICTSPLNVVPTTSKAPTVPDQPPAPPTNSPTPAPTKPSFDFDEYCGWSTTDGVMEAMIDTFSGTPSVTVDFTVPTVNTNWAGTLKYTYSIDGGAQVDTSAGAQFSSEFNFGKFAVAVGAVALDDDNVPVSTASCSVVVDVAYSDKTDVAQVVINGTYTVDLTNMAYDYTIEVEATEVDVKPVLRFGQTSSPISNSASFRPSDDVNEVFQFTITAQNLQSTATVNVTAVRIVPQENPKFDIDCNEYSTTVTPETGSSYTLNSLADLTKPTASDPNTGASVNVDGPLDITFPYSCNSGTTCEFKWKATKTHDNTEYSSECSYTIEVKERTNSLCQTQFSYSTDGTVSQATSMDFGRGAVVLTTAEAGSSITVTVDSVDPEGSGDSQTFASASSTEVTLSCGAQDPTTPKSEYKVTFEVLLDLELDSLSSPQTSSLQSTYDLNKNKATYFAGDLAEDKYSLSWTNNNGLEVACQYTDSQGNAQVATSGSEIVYGSFGIFSNEFTLTDKADPGRVNKFSVSVDVPAQPGATLALYQIKDLTVWDNMCKSLPTGVECAPFAPNQNVLRGQETDVDNVRNNLVQDDTDSWMFISQFTEPSTAGRRRLLNSNRRLLQSDFELDVTFAALGLETFTLDGEGSRDLTASSATLASDQITWKFSNDDDVQSVYLGMGAWSQLTSSDLTSDNSDTIQLDYGLNTMQITVTYKPTGSTFPTTVTFTIRINRPPPTVKLTYTNGPSLNQLEDLEFEATMDAALGVDVEVSLACDGLTCPADNKVTIAAGELTASGTVTAPAADTDTKANFRITGATVASAPEPYIDTQATEITWKTLNVPLYVSTSTDYVEVGASLDIIVSRVKGGGQLVGTCSVNHPGGVEEYDLTVQESSTGANAQQAVDLSSLDGKAYPSLDGSVTLTNVDGGTIGQPAEVDVKFVGNPATLNSFASDKASTQGNDTITFTVQVDLPSTVDIVVGISMFGYTPATVTAPSSVTIPQGATEATFSADVGFPEIGSSDSEFRFDVTGITPSSYKIQATKSSEVAIIVPVVIVIMEGDTTAAENIFKENEQFNVVVSQDQSNAPTNFFTMSFDANNVNSLEPFPSIPKGEKIVQVPVKYNDDNVIQATQVVTYSLTPSNTDIFQASMAEYAFSVENTETTQIEVAVGGKSDLSWYITLDTALQIETDVTFHVEMSSDSTAVTQTKEVTLKAMTFSNGASFDVSALTGSQGLTFKVTGMTASDSSLEKFIITTGAEVTEQYELSLCSLNGGSKEFVGTRRVASSNGANNLVQPAVQSETDFGILDSNNAAGGWIGNIFDSPWYYDIELGGGFIEAVTGVLMQGNNKVPDYQLKNFNLSTSLDNVTWTMQKEFSTPSPFPSANTKTQYLLDTAVSARYLRISFDKNTDFQNSPSFRVNGYGCVESLCQDDPNAGTSYGKCDSYAEGYGNHGFCDTDKYNDQFMSYWCPRACGLCGPPAGPPTEAPSMPPTNNPTASPTVDPDTDWPNSGTCGAYPNEQCCSAPPSSWAGIGFGSCRSYSHDECASNPLCNFYFCAVDGANYYCPVECNTCNVDDRTWRSPYGNCASYAQSLCTNNNDCNFNYCSSDKDTTTGVLARVACKKSCETGDIPKPTEKPAMTDCPIEDSTTWDGGYGDCDTYKEELCDNNPSCNYQYCDADGASASDACPIACNSCNGCSQLAQDTCDGLCSDENPIECVVGAPNQQCFCDVSCANTDDCCPGRANTCSQSRDEGRGGDRSRGNRSRAGRSAGRGGRGGRSSGARSSSSGRSGRSGRSERSSVAQRQRGN